MHHQLDTGNALLRHYLVSLAFRFRHVTEGAPAAFGDFEAGAGVRTPAAIVRHMAGMIRFVRSCFEEIDRPRFEPLPWEAERERFLAEVRGLDRVFAAGLSLRQPEPGLAQLWQGQLSDTMTHVGQLATLRRLAGAPIEPVPYWRVEMDPLG